MKKLTPEDLRALVELDQQRTKGLVYGEVSDALEGPVPTDPVVLGRIMTDCFKNEPNGRPAFMVWSGDPNRPLVVAITGNGPTSEANAKWITAVAALLPGLLSDLETESAARVKASAAMTEALELLARCLVEVREPNLYEALHAFLFKTPAKRPLYLTCPDCDGTGIRGGINPGGPCPRGCPVPPSVPDHLRHAPYAVDPRTKEDRIVCDHCGKVGTLAEIMQDQKPCPVLAKARGSRPQRRRSRARSWRRHAGPARRGGEAMKRPYSDRQAEIMVWMAQAGNACGWCWMTVGATLRGLARRKVPLVEIGCGEARLTDAGKAEVASLKMQGLTTTVLA